MDENKVDFEKMTPAERLKYEVAEEIGLADKAAVWLEKPDCQGERADWRSDDEEKAGDETE